MKLSKLMAALFVMGSINIVLAADPNIDKYVVSFPDQDRVSYQGLYQSQFPEGIPMGIGSGLYFVGEEQGKLKFVTVTDRGANADAPQLDGGESKIFVTPNFTPTMMDIVVDEKGAVSINPVSLKDQNGLISGLPLSSEYIGSTHEVPLSETLEILSTVDNGLDLEGIVSDGKDGYWVCDEYGPFIAHISADGTILKKLGPTPNENEKAVASGLPNILKWRQANRGFEGIARLPDGTIIVAVQSGLNIEGETKKTAEVTRLVAYNPETEESKMYAYPIDVDAYNKLGDAKIGDIVALDQNRILVIEQGKSKANGMRNLIYIVDLSEATDLTASDKIRPVEFDSLAEIENRDIQVAKKELLIDLRDYGWQQEKAEGLALIDKRRIALINDNDFGINAVLKNGKDGTKIKDYTLLESGKLALNGEETETQILIEPSKSPDNLSELWVVTFDHDI